MVASGAFAQTTTPERRWELQFENVFAGGTKPLFVYAREQNGEWLAGVGSSRDPGRNIGGGSKSFNKSWYWADLSGVPVRDGQIKGRIKVYLTPDPWVPSDHKMAIAEFDVEALVEKESLTGTYKRLEAGGDMAGFGKEGKLSGKAEVKPNAPLPDPATFRFNLHGGLVGGDPKVGERCLVALFGVEKGKLVSAAHGRLDAGGRSYGGVNNVIAVPLDGLVFSNDANRVWAHGIVAAPTLDMDDCQYVFDLQGVRLDGLLVGTYSLTARVAGKPDVVVNGAFEGAVNGGINLPKTNPGGVAAPSFRYVDVADFTPPKPGEHPRLLFRKNDLPALKKRAETPEGKAILARLRYLLGDNGDVFPTVMQKATGGYKEGTMSSTSVREVGALSLGHAAGYGLLFQLTGERKYADLGRRCFETWMTGVRDIDSRYSFVGPNGELRAGSSWAVAALGYDLCYEGWDESFRRKVAEAFLTVKIEQQTSDLKTVVCAPSKQPAKNHFGGIICGGAAAAAIPGDPGTEHAGIEGWMNPAYAHLVAMLTRGFGDHGFYAEGHGPSHVSSDTGLLLWMQVARVACGKDFISPGPNGQWVTLRWVMELVPQGGQPQVLDRKSNAGGGYGTERFDRVGPWSHSGQFSQGFGAVDPKFHPALLWVYENFVEPSEQTGGLGARAGKSEWIPKGTKSYDAIIAPWHAVMAFMTWPIGVKPANPETVMPKAMCDATFGYYVFRNRWQDGDDILVSALLGYGPTESYRPQYGPLYVWGYGQKFSFGSFEASKTDLYEPKQDGSGLVVAEGRQLAVDMSGASGAGVLLATIGIGEGNGGSGDVKLVSQTVTLGGQAVTLTLLAKGIVPEVKREGDKAIVGGQTVAFDGKRIVFSPRR